MSFLGKLKNKRSDWVRANRENGFEEGILNLLTELYPDNAHFIYELLQNAEDAQATRVEFELSPTALVCRHNGQREFSEENVESITSIGKTTKKDDVNQIGKFGVGFKAVFSYTDSPRVHSGTFNFEILDLVCPNEITPLAGLGTDTVFAFPFNKQGKPQSAAFAEVKKGLEDLSETTLLFLTNIKQIKWRTTDGSCADITRLALSDLQYEIEYFRNGKERRAVEWLRFADQVVGKPQHHVAIAFALEALEKPSKYVQAGLLGHLYRVKRCDGQVSIYFPAEKEASKLRFHIHAPFASTVARDSIRSRSENEPLIGQLALLLKRALHGIRAQGLLTTDFLDVLPLLDDGLSDFYRPLMKAVLEVMTTDQLTPTNARGHAPASRLIQGSSVLKDLLNEDDLNYVLDATQEHRATWATNAIQNSRAERFLKALEIRHITGEFFHNFILSNAIPKVSSKWDRTTKTFENIWEGQPGRTPDDFRRALWSWFDKHDDAWMQRFYATLENIGRTDVFRPVAALSKAPIVRISTGTYLAGIFSYFPSEGVEEDPVFPRVRTLVFNSGRGEQEKQAAKGFLNNVGVQTVGPREDIERILKTRYTNETEFPSVVDHLKDMQKFIRYWQEKLGDINVFSGVSIFFSHDEQHFCNASVAYLDSPFVDTGLASLYESTSTGYRRVKWGLNPKYLKHKEISRNIVDFAVAVGVQRAIPIAKVGTYGHPNLRELQADRTTGAKRRDAGRDEDYEIKDLEALLLPAQLGFSRAIWLTMCAADADVLEARFQLNGQLTLRRDHSRLVLKLRKLAWIPLSDGTFVTPDKATEKTIFAALSANNTNGWLTAVGFGESEKKQSELYQKKEQAVVSDGFTDLEEYHDVRDVMRDIPSGQRKQVIEELRTRFSRPPEERRFPDRPVRNPELRWSRVSDEVCETPSKTTKEVKRRVQVNYNDAKTDAREYLRQQYTNEYQVMLCQVCRDELPFKNLDGEYFFEAVALVEHLPKFLGKGFLCLCPNHAAMYKHSNAEKLKMGELLETAEGLDVTVMMGGRERTIEFTETHLTDMRASLKAMDETDGDDAA